MNDESQAQHCGDTCSVVASMAAAFSQYVPAEQRMAQAIEAVQSGKMSQRAAAQKFDVAQRTLSHRLEKVSHLAHPAKPVAAEGESGDRGSIAGDRTRLERQRVHKALRALAKSVGITHAGEIPIGRAGLGQVYAAITEAGHSVPEDIKPASHKKNKSQPTNENRKLQATGIQADDHDDDHDDDPLLADRIDIKQLNARVLEDVLNSNRPRSFKRAVELLTELEEIAVRSWYGEGDWSEQDWVHVNSQVKTIQSLTGQRAEEAHSAFLERVRVKKGAITV